MKQVSKRPRKDKAAKSYDDADAILEHALHRTFDVLLEAMAPPDAIQELRFLAESLDRRIDRLLFDHEPPQKGEIDAR